LVGAAGCTAPARAEPLGTGVGPIGVAGVAPVAAVLEIVRETQEVAGSPLPLRRALAHARGAELSHGGETGGRRAPITGVGRVAVAVAPRAPRAPGVAPRAPGVAPPRAAARRIVGCGSAAGASGGSLQLLELPLGSAAGERQQGEQQGSRRRGASAGRGGAVQRPNEAAVQVRGVLHRQRSVLLPSSCRDTLEPAVTFPRRAPGGTRRGARAPSDVDEAATNSWSRGRPRTFTSP